MPDVGITTHTESCCVGTSNSAFSTAFAIVGSAADAEDVTQEAFVKAYRALGRFRRREPFRPWLLGIVANEAKRNRLRSIARRHAAAERAAAELATRDVPSSPEGGAVAAEERRALLAAVARLAPDDRLAIVGRYFLGLTDGEAAAALGVRRTAVKMRVHRALARLRAELSEESP